MFDLGFSKVYCENVIDKLNCLIRFSNTKDGSELAKLIDKPVHYTNDLSPSFYEVSERFVLLYLRRFAQHDPQHCNCDVSLFGDDDDNLINTFMVEFLDVLANDFRSEFEYNACNFLRTCMTGQKVCDLGKPAFDMYFYRFYRVVVSAYIQRFISE